jgi:hypothetical protein
MTLYMVLEDGADPREGPKLHRRMVARPAFTWLAPPRERGRVTVAALLDAPTSAAYVDAVWAWARDVWRAWHPHHDVVRTWIALSLS